MLTMTQPNTIEESNVMQHVHLNHGRTDTCDYDTALFIPHKDKPRNNVAEAHCYALQCRQIDCKHFHSSIK